MRNVRDYGAVGDGIALDTAAIQKAIDDGGMVYIPEGVYRTGTIYLKSNGGLHLAPGAILRGSHERKDYNTDDFCSQNRVWKEEFVTGAHLITAIEQENIVIEGHGIIDGQGDFWMNENNMKPGWPDKDNYDYVANPERPGQMIFICECKNVHVTDVSIENGPYWHLFFHGCDDVHVRGVSIHGARPRWTNDGIDVDCCSRVTISDCVIDVGDDGITLRGNDEPLKEKKCCEKVVVTNCIIHAHRDYGIRIGVGNGVIRDCTISNCIVEAPNISGIGVFGRWSEASKSASSVENILISNVNIRAKCPVEICAAYGELPLPHDIYIRNIRMDNLMFFADRANVIKGFKGAQLEHIYMNNVTMQMESSGNVIEAENVSNMAINNFVFDGDNNNIKIKDCKNISLNE